MELGTEFKEKQRWRFIETFGGIFWSLILPAAAVILAVFVDYPKLGYAETGSIIFAYIAILILEIAAIKIFFTGLNDLYFNGKTALVVYDGSLQISIKAKKLFKSNLVTVDFKDIADFGVSQAKTVWRRGNAWSGKVYKVKYHDDGVVSFKTSGGNKYFSVSVGGCMQAARLIAAKLDESQIAKTENDLTEVSPD